MLHSCQGRGVMGVAMTSFLRLNQDEVSSLIMRNPNNETIDGS